MSAPKPPANAAQFVDILGVDGAVAFFLKFGGAEMFHAVDPKGRSEVAKTVGIEKARRLAEGSVSLKARIPIPKQWMAQVMKSNGLSVSEIARTLHITNVTVYKYLDADGTKSRGRTSDPRQFPLL